MANNGNETESIKEKLIHKELARIQHTKIAIAESDSNPNQKKKNRIFLKTIPQKPHNLHNCHSTSTTDFSFFIFIDSLYLYIRSKNSEKKKKRKNKEKISWVEDDETSASETDEERSNQIASPDSPADCTDNIPDAESHRCCRFRTSPAMTSAEAQSESHICDSSETNWPPRDRICCSSETNRSSKQRTMTSTMKKGKPTSMTSERRGRHGSSRGRRDRRARRRLRDLHRIWRKQVRRRVPR